MDRRVTTQDISWFLDLRRTAQLELDPAYQRKSVWSPADRRNFLDTIFRSYPSPAIFLHKREATANAPQQYEVVDGKQRLETIFMFVDNKLALPQEFGDARLDGKKWLQIDEPELKRRLWDYVLPVEFIRLVEGTVVNEVFSRLNRNSRRLERQELRHARYDGWFVNLAEQEAEDPFWKEMGISSTGRSKRMKDVQFISELLMVIIRNEVRGFDQDSLDQMYADFEVPADTDPDFDSERILAKLACAKRVIEAWVKAHPALRVALKGMSHFYSVWGYLVLEASQQKMDDPETGKRYSAFITRSQDLHESALEGIDVLPPGSDTALKYAFNARGAATEAPQRKARHDALLEELGA